jgi:hypothetical protein
MSISEKEKLTALCASIIFSMRFKRELEKASNHGDIVAKEETIPVSRETAIAEAVEIAGEIVKRCDH